MHYGQLTSDRFFFLLAAAIIYLIGVIGVTIFGNVPLNNMKTIILFFLLVFYTPLLSIAQTIKFAAIGDYGKAGHAELAVSNLVKSWNPDFIITLGDNNYPYGEEATIDSNIGQYYHEFISPYMGNFGLGDTVNRFFPSMGNHDWDSPGGTPYLNYFTLPGNERYYDTIIGNIHFLVISSDPREPDGIDSNSIQGSMVEESTRSVFRKVEYNIFSSSTLQFRCISWFRFNNAMAI